MGPNTTIKDMSMRSVRTKDLFAVAVVDLLCAMAMGVTPVSMAEDKVNVEDLSAEALVEKMIQDCRGNGFDEWQSLSGREDVLPVMLKRMEPEGRRVKEQLLRLALAVGYQVEPKQTRWVFSRPVARFLVDVLLKEKNLDVRDKAAGLLVKEVSGCCIAPLAEDILKAVAQPRPLSHKVLLLGKTGCVEAREMLLKDRRVQKESDIETDMALARLGDTERSMQLVEKFEKENNPEEKARLAGCLGYVGDAACVMALARAMRCPMIYRRGVARIAVRVEIMKALNGVYPEIQVFWHDRMNPPRDNSWYERAEKWLTRYLKIKWDKPRPPFFETEIRPDPA